MDNDPFPKEDHHHQTPPPPPPTLPPPPPTLPPPPPPPSQQQTQLSSPPSTPASNSSGRWPKLDLASRNPTATVETTPPATAASRKADATPKDLGLKAWRGLARDPDAPGGLKGRKKDAAKFVSKLRLGTSTPKSLVPVSEKKSQDDSAVSPTGRPRRDQGTDRWDIAPDGGSASREGRQFTVATVGANGRIYLRPMIRPVHSRYPQPHFVFPAPPPEAAGLDAMVRGQASSSQQPAAPELAGNVWTPVTRKPSFPGQRRRALSDSSIHEPEPGGFKIVISKPEYEQKAKTMEDISEVSSQSPQLDISIPSWKIGSPRFSARGTAAIQGGSSSYAPTEEADATSRSRSGSVMNTKPPSPLFSPRGPTSPALTASVASSARSSSCFIPPLSFPGFGRQSLQPPTLVPPKATIATYAGPARLIIEPGMFDALTLKPECDDRSVVRYSPTTGAITAATPARLVAEITSPNVLDYELLSDFFLTYRSFLESGDLLQMLMARWRWGMRRNDDELGTVCRVRTFVAVRHWILNYFTQDFLHDHALRLSFCDLVNQLVQEMSHDVRVRKVQVKILAELKKCWRRVCAQFWDDPEFDDCDDVIAPLAPGGIVGHCDAAEFSDRQDGDESPPQIKDDDNDNDDDDDDNEVSRAAGAGGAGGVGVDDTIIMEPRPATPPDAAMGPNEMRQQASSPTSMASVDALSCSFTGKALRNLHQASTYPLAAHPVTVSSLYTQATIATTPRSLHGKRVRPSQSISHKRNGSLTDSLRGHGPERQTFGGGSFGDEPIFPMPYAGSLVRGNLMPPSQAFVDVVLPAGGGLADESQRLDAQPDRFAASAMSGPGMKRLIGSVRRALNKAPGLSPTQTTFIDISPLGPKGATTNRLPGTPIVPQAPAHHQEGKPLVRIDLLGADVAEHFKKAVREEQAAEAGAGADLLLDADLTKTMTRPTSVAGLTAGSKSILIIDGTMQNDIPVMSGALPAVSPSEGVSDSFLVNGAGPTPPTTPPDHLVGTPRRSSYLINQHVMHPSISDQHDATPASDEQGMPPADTEKAQKISTNSTNMEPMPVPRPFPFPFPFQETQPSAAVVPRPSQDSHRLSVAPPSGSAALPRPSQDSSSSSSSRSIPPPQRPFQESRLSNYSPSIAPSWAPSWAPNGRSSPNPVALRAHRRLPSSITRQSLSSIVRRRCASFHSGMEPRSASRLSEYASTLSEASDADQEPGVDGAQPLRTLRRRPGGDLRAAQNVGDLNPALGRSRSLASLTTYSESFEGSYLYSPARDDFSDFVDAGSTHSRSRRRDGQFSIGAMAEPAKRDISLFSTHSSLPLMRPSFEIEAQKLALIPDDDDGSPESALLKLEGRFEKKMHRLSMEPRKRAPSSPLAESHGAGDGDGDHQPPDADLMPDIGKKEKWHHRHLHVANDTILAPNLTDSDERGGDDSFSSGPDYSFLDMPQQHPANETRSSHSSPSVQIIPAVAGNSNDNHEGRPKAVQKDDWTSSVLRDADDETTPPSTDKAASEQASFSFIDSNGSFLEDESKDENKDENKDEKDEKDETKDESSDAGDSDLSSEMSAEAAESDHADVGEDGLPMMMMRVGARPPPGPLGEPARVVRDDYLPSPPTFTLAHGQQQALYMPHDRTKIKISVPQSQSHEAWDGTSSPPTTPLATTQTNNNNNNNAAAADTTPRPPPAARSRKATLSGQRSQKTITQSIHDKYAAHLPFILAFESDVLAQQFTLIEKDALEELDWKELIDMAWKKSTCGDSRSWVDFLRNSEAHGVEVVIARFNIMVKWAVSEIVLTQDIEERARCITKYIHIASHCRRYRNFATLSQITIALSSKEVSGLSRTWALVAPGDTAVLGELEQLVSPTRNFYALRAEMEVGTDTGCIPFVGIYTHDLVFNAQRSSEIASAPNAAPLVNFERCRTAAGIVKTVLRLVEASMLYEFQPIEGITERCLWMGALSDDEIRMHAARLD